MNNSNIREIAKRNCLEKVDYHREGNELYVHDESEGEIPVRVTGERVRSTLDGITLLELILDNRSFMDRMRDVTLAQNLVTPSKIYIITDGKEAYIVSNGKQLK